MKKFLLVTLILVLAMSIAGIAACNVDKNVAFDKSDYEINDGDKLSVVGNAKDVTYKLLTSVDGVSLDALTGRFSIDQSVADYTQVVVAVLADGKVSDTAICCLRTATQAPAITFSNLSNYIVSGDTVTAVSTPSYSITYSLRQDYAGISIDSVNGKVTFSGSVDDGINFTVVASAKGISSEKTFTTAVGNYVVAEVNEGIAEYQVGSDVKFVLDYQDNPEAEQNGVLAVMRGNTRLTDNDYLYDKTTREVTVKASYTASLSMGDNVLKIVTSKNAVSATVKVARFVATAADLAAINATREALSGNYIMVCDIDLTEYLSVSGAGYNNGKGWTPIGTYYDLRVGAETEWAFAGTFDGNGHTVSGFFIDRSDDYAYNSGFFGYIASQGVVKNLGLRNGEGKVNNVRSYSGGFVGVNVGRISDCWAEVDVITGEAFKVVGGFVGRNEGQIDNCYSLGRVVAGSEVGSFAGVSRTPISLGVQNNCYAVQTGAYPFSNDYNDTCKVVSSKSDIVNCDFSAYENKWNVTQGNLPTLKSIEIDYDLRELTISCDKVFAVSGETFKLTVTTNPLSSLEKYGCTFERVEGRGVRIDENGVIDTNNVQFGGSAEPVYCVVKATCGELSALYGFYVYDQVQSITFADDMERTVYAGGYYQIDAIVKPVAANQQVTYRLVKSMYGVTLDDSGVIAVSNNILNDGEITVRITASDGQYDELTISVIANRRFDGNYAIVYREDNNPVVFTLPQGLTSGITKVTRYDKSIDYQIDGDVVRLDRSYFVDFDDKEVPVKFITDNAVYMAMVVAYNKADVYEIGSVDEFMKYKSAFMTTPELRSKVVILTADLDFNGAEITSIGSHHLDADFLGVFNGNGHTISNLKINRNDFDGLRCATCTEYFAKDDCLLYCETCKKSVESEKHLNAEQIQCSGTAERHCPNCNVKVQGQDEYPFHASRYNVGLFSYVKGMVANVKFVNVEVANYFSGTYQDADGGERVYEKEPIGNFIGVVAGTVEGTVSNCTFTNCQVKGGDLKGTVCGKDTSTLVSNCVINGNLYEK